jgi:hypothetical protein
VAVAFQPCLQLALAVPCSLPCRLWRLISQTSFTPTYEDPCLSPYIPSVLFAARFPRVRTVPHFMFTDHPKSFTSSPFAFYLLHTYKRPSHCVALGYSYILCLCIICAKVSLGVSQLHQTPAEYSISIFDELNALDAFPPPPFPTRLYIVTGTCSSRRPTRSALHHSWKQLRCYFDKYQQTEMANSVSYCSIVRVLEPLKRPPVYHTHYETVSLFRSFSFFHYIHRVFRPRLWENPDIEAFRS